MPKRISVDGRNFAQAVAQAAEVLQAGGVIAYPTETVYGLGALLGRPGAVARIRALKGKTEPMPALVSGPKMAGQYVEMDERAKRVMKKFWPGPLTIILKGKASVPAEALGAAQGLGVRMSSDRLAQALVEAVEEAITSTSANRTGKEPLADGLELERELGAELDLILDCGRRAGRASTVIDLSGKEPRLVREGPVKFKEILEALQWQG